MAPKWIRSSAPVWACLFILCMAQEPKFAVNSLCKCERRTFATCSVAAGTPQLCSAVQCQGYVCLSDEEAAEDAPTCRVRRGYFLRSTGSALPGSEAYPCEQQEVLYAVPNWIQSFPDKPCQNAQAYEVELSFNWTANTYANSEFPVNAGFSKVVAASHSAGYTLFSMRQFASQGVQQFAETGNSDGLVNEMQGSRNILSISGTDFTTASTETVRFFVRVSRLFPLTSCMAKVDPSPDWFVGLSSVDMCDHTSGNWLNGRSGDLIALDAGTDDGSAFTAEDQPSEDARVVQQLDENFIPRGRAIGRFRLTKIDEEIFEEDGGGGVPLFTSGNLNALNSKSDANKGEYTDSPEQLMAPKPQAFPESVEY